MNRGEQKINRVKFVQMAIKNNKKAAYELKLMAIGLQECRNTNQTITALSDIFGVSKATIMRDLEIEI